MCASVNTNRLGLNNQSVSWFEIDDNYALKAKGTNNENDWSNYHKVRNKCVGLSHAPVSRKYHQPLPFLTFYLHIYFQSNFLIISYLNSYHLLPLLWISNEGDRFTQWFLNPIELCVYTRYKILYFPNQGPWRAWYNIYI